MKRKLTMILMMLAVSIGFGLAGAQSANAAAGEKIAFASNRDGNFDIYVMNADGTNPIRLTNNGGFDEDPSFSPDGSKIAFVSDRDSGNAEIYVMNADGSNITRLTNSGVDFEPSFSPDGSKIAFTPSAPATLILT